MDTLTPRVQQTSMADRSIAKPPSCSNTEAQGPIFMWLGVGNDNQTLNHAASSRPSECPSHAARGPVYRSDALSGGKASHPVLWSQPRDPTSVVEDGVTVPTARTSGRRPSSSSTPGWRGLLPSTPVNGRTGREEGGGGSLAKTHRTTLVIRVTLRPIGPLRVLARIAERLLLLLLRRIAHPLLRIAHPLLWVVTLRRRCVAVVVSRVALGRAVVALLLLLLLLLLVRGLRRLRSEAGAVGRWRSVVLASHVFCL